MGKFIFLILCLEGAVLSFNVSATSAMLPSIAKDFGLEPFYLSAIVWLYMLPYGIGALFYGPLVRTFNIKFVELICFFCFCLANLFVAISKNIFVLYLARFFMGVFGASVIPLVLILIAKTVGKKNRGKFVGIFFSITFIASLLGLFLSGFIYWRFIFLIPAIFGFLLLLTMVFSFPDFSFPKENFKIRYLETFKDKKIFSIFSYIFLISMLYHGVQQWLGVYFSKEFSFDQRTISFLISLSSLSGIFGEAIGGWLSDFLGRIKTINLGIFLMIISVFLLIFKLPIIILSVVLIIWGLGWTFNHAGLSTILTDLPKKFLNEVASLNSSVRFFSGGCGVFLAGIFMRKSFIFGLIFLGFLFIALRFSSRYLLIEEEVLNVS
ncbi:MAG: MFS transporter [Candidatus Omnitrophica bacterium]|nr:MFS transporter [Candidatus Omnitrophota bacterium]